jgi:hypothetical protein
MKKLIFSLFVFWTLTISAQWYTDQFGVTNMNELSKEQLNIAFTQAEKTTNIGIVMTIIGIPAIIIGGVMYSKGLNEIVEEDVDQGLDKSIAGALIMGVGGISMSIGIPLWMMGNNRKNIITVHLAKFKEQSYIPSVGIRVYF